MFGSVKAPARVSSSSTRVAAAYCDVKPVSAGIACYAESRLAMTHAEIQLDDRQRRHLRGRIGSLSRDRAQDDPELIEAKRRLKADRTAEAIRAAVEQWPPLTGAQRERLALLLSQRDGDGGAA